MHGVKYFKSYFKFCHIEVVWIDDSMCDPVHYAETELGSFDYNRHLELLIVM